MAGPSLYTNTVCPITLEELSSAPEASHVFVHGTTGFMAKDLYLYLMSSLYFTNPITRVPFDLESLGALEARMRAAFGDDAIETASMPSPSLENRAAPWAFEDDGMRELGEGEILERIAIRVIKAEEEGAEIEVDLDLEGVLGPVIIDNVPADIPPPPNDPEPVNDDAMPYPSIVRLFLDNGRARRLKEELDLVQFLEYESGEVFRRLCAAANEAQWQRWVWEQTSAIVLEHITDCVCEDEIRDIVHDLPDFHDPDMNVDIHYTSAWDTYRLALMTMWEQRLTRVVGDMAQLNREEARLLIKVNKARAPLEDVEQLHGFLETVKEHLGL